MPERGRGAHAIVVRFLFVFFCFVLFCFVLFIVFFFSYEGDIDNLGKVERFFLELLSVPRVRSRLGKRNIF